MLRSCCMCTTTAALLRRRPTWDPSGRDSRASVSSAPSACSVSSARIMVCSRHSRHSAGTMGEWQAFRAQQRGNGRFPISSATGTVALLASQLCLSPAQRRVDSKAWRTLSPSPLLAEGPATRKS